MPQMTDERVRAGVSHEEIISFLNPNDVKTHQVFNKVVDILDSDGTFSKEKGEYQ